MGLPLGLIFLSKEMHGCKPAAGAGLLQQPKCFHYKKSAMFACMCIDAIRHEESPLVRADGRWCWSSWRLMWVCVPLYLVHKQVATDTYILRRIQNEPRTRKMQAPINSRIRLAIVYISFYRQQVLWKDQSLTSVGVSLNIAQLLYPVCNSQPQGDFSCYWRHTSLKAGHKNRINNFLQQLELHF